jgi:hypothetical protein
VVSHLSWSSLTSCVGSCCDGDHDAPNAHIQRAIPCCDIDLRSELAADARVLLPERKSGAAETCGDASVRHGVFQTDVPVVTTPPSTQVSHPLTYTPLRI